MSPCLSAHRSNKGRARTQAQATSLCLLRPHVAQLPAQLHAHTCTTPYFQLLLQGIREEYHAFRDNAALIMLLGPLSLVLGMSWADRHQGVALGTGTLTPWLQTGAWRVGGSRWRWSAAREGVGACVRGEWGQGRWVRSVLVCGDSPRPFLLSLSLCPAAPARARMHACTYVNSFLSISTHT